MKVRRCFLIAVICMLAGADMAFAGYPVYSNYMAGNEFDHNKSLSSGRGPLFGDSRVAAPFTVPPGFDYSLDYIELTITAGWPSFGFTQNKIQVELWEGTNPIPVSDGGAAIKINATLPDYFNPGPPPPPGPRLLKFTPPISSILLKQGHQYWVIVGVKNFCCISSIPSVASASWMLNSAGVTGTEWLAIRRREITSMSFARCGPGRILHLKFFKGR